MENPASRALIPLILAPMAGYTDACFRMLCREQGADAAVTEMISAKGLLYGGAATRALLETEAGERRVIVQLFGREPRIMADMAKRIFDERPETFCAVDLNMGCPAHKITQNGEGCALMREPALAGAVVEAVARAVPAPVYVKFRKGWDAQSENAEAFAAVCESAGASGLCVHGRTREQQYAGCADWDCIRRVKARVRIPVVGNGDVTDGASARAMLEQTGADGVMVGRAALGNPWVFAEIRAALTGALYEPPAREERREMLLRHAGLCVDKRGDYALVELRKHLVRYIQNEPNAARLRVRVNACKTLDALSEILA